MAKSIAYYYDIIVTEKQTMSNLTGLQPSVDTAQTLLSDVTTTSRVARWRLWVWCVAVAMYSFDVLFDLFKIDLEAIAQSSRFGALPWYVTIAKSYQEGYNLVWVGNAYQYSVVNVPSQIITFAAAVELVTGPSALVNLKVAKGITPVPLSGTEIAAFKAYIQKIKPAGIVVTVISDVADDLRLFVDIGYDPLVLSAAGESLITPGTLPVQDAVNLFIQSLPFNGIMELDKLVDTVQVVFGVNNVYITSASARYGANPYLVFTERYTPNAGYLAIDSGTPLSSSINYIANV